MKLYKVIALIGMLAMTTVLSYGFLVGDFSQEGSLLAKMPWGIVSLVDLYVGFVLFSAWIVYRERSWWRSLIWVVLMMVLGFFTGAIYTLNALQQSKGNWMRFWLGNQHKQ